MLDENDDVTCEESPAPVEPSHGDLSHDDGKLAQSAGRAAAVVALAGAAAACGGGDSGNPNTGGGGGGTPTPTARKPETDAEAARFVMHAALSASTGAIAAVRRDGFEPWLDAEMRQSNDETAERFFSSRGYDAIDSNEYYFRSHLADNMVWKHLLRGNSSVRRRMAIALSEFFVVSANSVNNTWRAQAMGEYWDILNQHAFGNFRDLLEAITLNPAMGVFLNTLGNRKADPNTGRVPDENFGREIMQLFSIGLYELNIDGTQRLSGGEPIETYDNDDVTEIAKAFTGYDYDYSGITQQPAWNASYNIPTVEYIRRPMTADPSKWRRPRASGYHSEEAKSFLGTTIPAGTSAAETLRLTMDALFNHPNVGPFFGKQLIQRLVTSNPSPGYVQRVAQAFNDNGNGTRGDLGAVFKAVVLDDEALSANGLNDPRFGKLREPMLRMAQWGRTFGVTSASGEWNIRDLSNASNRLGQSPLRSPSVFNFFRPGYVPAGSQAATENLTAPEFQLVNESSVAGYVNFIERTIDASATWWLGDVTPNYSAEIAIAHDAQQLLDRLDLLLTANQLSTATRTTILDALNQYTVTQASSDAEKLQRVHAGVLLVMASNDYIVQK